MVFLVNSLKRKWKRWFHSKCLINQLARHVREPPCKWILQLQTSLQVATALANIWLQFYEKVKHKCPIEPLFNSLLTEIVRDYFYCSKPLSFLICRNQIGNILSITNIYRYCTKYPAYGLNHMIIQGNFLLYNFNVLTVWHVINYISFPIKFLWDKKTQPNI